MALSIATVAVDDLEQFARDNPKLVTLIEDRATKAAEAKFSEMSAKDKCYSLLVLSLIAGVAALYGYFAHDTFLLASVGAFSAPLIGLLTKYCGRLRIAIKSP